MRGQLLLLLLLLSAALSHPTQGRLNLNATRKICADMLLKEIRIVCQMTSRGRSLDWGEEEYLYGEEEYQREEELPQRENIVDICCRNPCSKAKLQSYCKYSNEFPQRLEATTTTTTTTTTTPTPPPKKERKKEKAHRLKLPRKGLKDRVKEELLRKAMECLHDPKCVGEGGGGFDHKSGRSRFCRKASLSTMSKGVPRGPHFGQPNLTPALSGVAEETKENTDTPIESHRGIPLGTNDGIYFNN